MHDLVNERRSEMDNQMILFFYFPFDEAPEAVDDTEKSVIAI